MKIAIICPIGNLNRFGYWRVAQPCFESWKAIGPLYLIHSSRTAIPFVIQAEYIQDDFTLMRMVDGAEWFDHRLVADNANRGIALARAAGYDVAITVCVNWYIEHDAAQRIIEKCAQMLEENGRFAFLYRRLQMGDRLFDSDTESIAIINIRKIKQDCVKILVDRIEVNGVIIESMRGDFSDMHAEAYIDCEYELTTDELKEKLTDVRNYAEILPKRRGVDWDYWLHYYQQRVTTLRMSEDGLGPIGLQIAAQHPHDAFSDWLMSKAAA